MRRVKYEDVTKIAVEVAVGANVAGHDVTHALVVVCRADGSLDIGLAGPAATAEPILGVLRVVKAHVEDVMGSRGELHKIRQEATIDGHRVEVFGPREGKN